MQALAASAGVSPKHLSASLDLAHSTVSGIVDRPEKRSFVNRQVLKSDHRVTQITVSKAVRKFLDRQGPELTLHPLLNALRRASESEHNAVTNGIETLDKLLN